MPKPPPRSATLPPRPRPRSLPTAASLPTNGAAQPTITPHRRSRHELRLEQIAIWGDAAAYRGRVERDVHPSSHKRSATAPTEAALFAPAHHADLFDITTLERDLEAAELPVCEVDVDAAPRGSMSLCNSRSAETFRKSGSYAAKARASVRRNLRKEGSDAASAALRRESSTAASGKERRIVITRRAAMKGREFRMETAIPRGDAEQARRMSSGGGIGRRFSEARRSIRPEPPFTEPILLMSQKESMEMRERDENDFRLSNAKLPERVDPSSARTPDWGEFRRARSNSAPILGRYTRSRSSQLPGLRSVKLGG